MVEGEGGGKKGSATLRAHARINYYFRPSWSNICANRKSRRASGSSRFAPYRSLRGFPSLRSQPSGDSNDEKREETIAILFIAAVKARWEITIVGLSATASIHDYFVVRQLAKGRKNRCGKTIIKKSRIVIVICWYGSCWRVGAFFIIAMSRLYREP